MSQLSRKRGKRGASLFGCAVHLICLTLVANLGLGVRAEETPVVAQANELTAGNNAKDLGGATLAASPGTMPTAQAVAPVLAQAKPVAAADDDDEPIDLLGEFNVTALRRRVTERENTQTTYVVKREQIEALGATTVSDALRLVPGVSFAESAGGIDNRGQNFLRGFDDSRFVLLQDGRPLIRPSNNRSVALSSFPVANVERIEVVTGGGSLRYGADAVGGVINIITRIPEGPPKLTIGSQVGSFGFSQYTLSYSGSTGPIDKPGNFAYEFLYQRQSVLNDYTFSYCPGSSQARGCYAQSAINPATGSRYTTSAAFNTFNGNYSGVSSKAYSLYSFSDFYSAKFVFKPAKEHTITIYAQQQNLRRPGTTVGNVSLFYVSGDRNDPNSYIARINDIAPGRPGSTITGTEQSFDSFGGYINWDWQMSEKSLLQTQASLNTEWFDNPGNGGQSFISNRIADLQIRYTSELYTGNTVNAGFQYTGNLSNQSLFPGARMDGVPVIDPATGAQTFPFSREVSRIAFYLTDDLSFFDKALIVNGGTRFTSDITFGNFWTSGAGLRYNFGGPTPSAAPYGLRFNWSQAFKTPGISQQFVTFIPASNGFQISIPNPGTVFGVNIGSGVQTEKSQGFDLGLDVQVSPTMLVRGTYFRTDLTNTIREGTYTGVAFGYNNGTAYRCNSAPYLSTSNCYQSYLRYIANPGKRGNLAYVFQTRNANSQLSTGWEFNFDWELDKNWRLAASHSIFDTRFLDGQNSLANGEAYTYNYQIAGQPYNITNFAATYTAPGFTASLNSQFVGARPNSGNQGPNVQRPAYNVFNLTFGIPVSPGLTFNGGIFNLFNTFYEVLGGTKRVAPGTSFRAGVTITF